MPDRVLITTDALEQAGFDTAMVSSLDDVRQAVRGRESGAGSREPDAIVLTGGLHETTAQRLLAAAREHAVSTLGLVESTDDPNEVGRELGLTGWLIKPADPAEVTATVRRLIERRRLQQRTGILGESAAIQEVLVKIEQIAPVTSTVLIEGESGTGKELVARAMHDLSPRRGKAFIAVNCAALPRHCSKVSCSVTRRAPSPAPPSDAWGGSSWRTAARSCWTKSARCRPRPR